MALGPIHSQNLALLQAHRSHPNSRSATPYATPVGTPYGTPVVSRHGTPISSKTSSPVVSRHTSPFNSRPTSPARCPSPPQTQQPFVGPTAAWPVAAAFPASCQSSFRQLTPNSHMSDFDTHIQLMERHLFQRFAL